MIVPRRSASATGSTGLRTPPDRRRNNTAGITVIVVLLLAVVVLAIVFYYVVVSPPVGLSLTFEYGSVAQAHPGFPSRCEDGEAPARQANVRG